MTCLAIAASVAVAAGSVPLLARFLQTAPVQKVVDRRSLAPSPPWSAAGPLRVERQFARIADDGVIGTANGVPVQLYRYRGVRQVWYFDPRTGKRLLVTIPESRSVLVPVRTF